MTILEFLPQEGSPVKDFVYCVIVNNVYMLVVMFPFLIIKGVETIALTHNLHRQRKQIQDF